jgi:penicillin-binding protein 2
MGPIFRDLATLLHQISKPIKSLAWENWLVIRWRTESGMGSVKVRVGFVHLAYFLALAILLEASGIAASVNPPAALTRHNKTRSVTENPHAKRRMRSLAKSHTSRSRRVATASVTHPAAAVTTHATARTTVRRHHYSERFYTSSFASDIIEGDQTGGEDPVVRQAAIDALGNMNGTVVAIEPTSGRILAMVNQHLALSSGAQPCSTIKLSVALAALSEGVIDAQTQVALGGSGRMNLTTALAKSNNAYFEAVGRKLGFEKVQYYAHQFGLGELAGYHIAGEQLGTYPEEEISEKLGGVSKMCSFGEGISMTPLQLGALVTAIANGGTMYYLQHPTTPEEVANFQPRVKRHLDIEPIIPELSDGMAGAVAYGTARTVRLNFNEETILGKTGTCSHAGTRYGWFASYANTDIGRIVTVVFLQGGRPTFGPKAAELAGRMYRNLYDHNFFVAGATGTDLRKVTTPAASQ